MTLDQIQVGQLAVLTNTVSNSLDSNLIDKLSSLGFNKKAVIMCIRKSILGNLIHIKIHQTVLVLKKKELKGISIEIIQHP